MDSAYRRPAPVTATRLFAACIMVWLAPLLLSSAQAAQVSVEPVFLYVDGYIDDSRYDQLRDSLDQAWADAQAYFTNCDFYGNCNSALNLHTDPSYSPSLTYNGIWYQHPFDKRACDSRGVCTYYPNFSSIQTSVVCPQGFYSNSYLQPGTSNPQVWTYWCQISIPDVQPPLSVARAAWEILCMPQRVKTFR